MTYGQIVKEARTKKGLGLQQLAARVGSVKGYICGIEKGHVNPPSPKVTRRLCAALGLNYHEMLVRSWAEKAPKELKVNVDRVLRVVVA